MVNMLELYGWNILSLLHNLNIKKRLVCNGRTKVLFTFKLFLTNSDQSRVGQSLTVLGHIIMSLLYHKNDATVTNT